MISKSGGVEEVFTRITLVFVVSLKSEVTSHGYSRLDNVNYLDLRERRNFVTKSELKILWYERTKRKVRNEEEFRSS